MAEDIKLTATVAVEDPFKVGSSFNNFSVTITNEGTQLTQKPPNRQFFYLDSAIGSGENALFNKKGDTDGVKFNLPPGWKPLWDFSNEICARLILSTNNSVFLGKDQSLKVDLSNIISKTAPGKATLTFSSSFQVDKSKSVALTIPKSAENPDIIYFSSNPPEGTPNLPGEIVTLKWLTYKLTDCELIQSGIADPLPYQKSVKDPKTNTIEVEKKITCGSSDTTYTLTGYDGSKPFVRTLDVKALRDGWQMGQAKRVISGRPRRPGAGVGRRGC